MGNLDRRLDELERIARRGKQTARFHMHDHEGGCMTYGNKCPGFAEVGAQVLTLNIPRPGQEEAVGG